MTKYRLNNLTYSDLKDKLEARKIHTTDLRILQYQAIIAFPGSKSDKFIKFKDEILDNKTIKHTVLY